MDPNATPAEPLPAVAGFPFVLPGTGAVIVGPTGGGRSSLIQACLYDAARAGRRCAYLGHEVTQPEFDARAALLAGTRGDEIDDALRGELARCRYLNLMETIALAWGAPGEWVEDAVRRFDVVVIDPLSAVASALGLNFDNDNNEYARFYDRLILPLTTRGVAVVAVENVGHAADAKSRPKGASAKQDRPDLMFSCKRVAGPEGLSIRATKVRTVRAPFRVGDEWVMARESQTIEQRRTDAAGDKFRPTVLMERVSEFLKEKPGASKNNIVKGGVSGNREALVTALDALIEEGFVEGRPKGSGSEYFNLREFRKDDHEERPVGGAKPDGPTYPEEPASEGCEAGEGGAIEKPMSTGFGPGAKAGPRRGQTALAPVAANRGHAGPGRSTGPDGPGSAPDLPAFEEKAGTNGHTPCACCPEKSIPERIVHSRRLAALRAKRAANEQAVVNGAQTLDDLATGRGAHPLLSMPQLLPNNSHEEGRDQRADPRDRPVDEQRHEEKPERSAFLRGEQLNDRNQPQEAA